MKQISTELQVSFIFHLTCFGINVAGWYYDRKFGDVLTMRRYAGRFKYIEHLYEYFNTIFCLFAVLVDLYCILGLEEVLRSVQKKSKTETEAKKSEESPAAEPGDESKDRLDSGTKAGKGNAVEESGPEAKPSKPTFDFKSSVCAQLESLKELSPVEFRDYIFTSVLFPLGTAITITFWMWTLYDPFSVVPYVNQRIINTYGVYNFYLHTFPLVFSVLGVILVYRKYPKQSVGLKISTGVALSYMLWLIWVAKIGKYLTYPFLRKWAWWKIGGYMICAVATSPVLYIAGEKLTEWFWIPEWERESLKEKED